MFVFNFEIECKINHNFSKIRIFLPFIMIIIE